MCATRSERLSREVWEDGVAAIASVRATSRHLHESALSDTPRRGPKRLEIQKETTLVDVRWSRVSWTRRDAARRTFATMMPIMKTNEVTASCPMPSAAAKKEIPSAKAIAEMIWMKWWISLLIGVCSASCVRDRHETAAARSRDA